MHSLIDGPNSYRVEVSGWDAREVFFVEKTMFHWSMSGEKSIGLMSRLREGCVVFVRLIHGAMVNSNFPVAYRVLSVASSDSDGRGFARLAQLHPHIESSREAIHAASQASTPAEAQKIMAD